MTKRKKKEEVVDVDYSAMDYQKSLTDSALDLQLERNKTHLVKLGPSLPDKGEKLRLKIISLEEEKQRRRVLHRSKMEEDDTERSRTRNHVERCKMMFKANALVKDEREESDEQEASSSDSSGSHLKFDQDVFRKSVSEMIVLNGLPFDFTESEGFMRFCNNLFPGYEEVSTRTVTKDIVAMFLKEKESLKKLFSDGKMRVSLTTDIWVAPTTSCSYLVITAYWIDVNWELQKRIISFKPVTDRQGSTIARHLIESVDECGIEKVFTVTVENSESNDTAVTLFKDAMRLKGANALVKDGEFLRMRCCGEVVNLIVKEIMERASDTIAAVRNAVKYVQSSFTRLKSFELRVETGKVCKDLLSLDDVTRWDSTYFMLMTARRLRVAFEKMLDEDKLYGEYFLEIEKETGKKRAGPPISATWDEVKRLVLFLGIFFDCTMGFSGSKSPASSNGYNEIANIDWSLISLSNDDDEEVKKQATSTRDKFNGLISITELVIVASVFDPRKKMLFASLCFDMLHGKDSLVSNHLTSSIRSVMRHLYEEYIIMLNKQPQSDDAATQRDHGDSEESSVVRYRRSDWLYKQMLIKLRKEQAGKELDDYLIETLEPWDLGSDYDVLSWWKRHSQRYPILSELARDVLAIQICSFPPESAFCTSGRVLDPYRSSLTPFITEALICTQQWLRTSVHSEAQLASLAQMIEELDFHQSLDSRKLHEFGEV